MVPVKKAPLLDGLDLNIIIDIVPAALFILDSDARILEINTGAAKLTDQKADITLRRLCGDVLHCLHAQNAPDGCGTTDYCPDCVIRSSVIASCKGQHIVKKKADLLVQKNGKITPCTFLISASPFTHCGKLYTILAMEDITELMILKKLVPICVSCKKIRKDENYWETIEKFLKRKYGAQMSHGICPDCAKKLYPGLNLDNKPD